jgi:hypothetical protein
MHHDQTTNRPDRLQVTSRLVFFGFIAVVAYFLITEHRAHLFGILPFLLIAACPLLHFFHHRGHDQEGGKSRSDSDGTTHQH